MRIRFAAGRAFTADDREGRPGVCIVNESLARRLFPGESPLGKVLLRGRERGHRVRDRRRHPRRQDNGLNAPAPDEIYYPLRQLARPGMASSRARRRIRRRCRRVIRAAVAAVDQGSADLVLRDARRPTSRRASAPSASSRR